MHAYPCLAPPAGASCVCDWAGWSSHSAECCCTSPGPAGWMLVKAGHRSGWTGCWWAGDERPGWNYPGHLGTGTQPPGHERLWGEQTVSETYSPEWRYCLRCPSKVVTILGAGSVSSTDTHFRTSLCTITFHLLSLMNWSRNGQCKSNGTCFMFNLINSANKQNIWTKLLR